MGNGIRRTLVLGLLLPVLLLGVTMGDPRRAEASGPAAVFLAPLENYYAGAGAGAGFTVLGATTAAGAVVTLGGVASAGAAVAAVAGAAYGGYRAIKWAWPSGYAPQAGPETYQTEGVNVMARDHFVTQFVQHSDSYVTFLIGRSLVSEGESPNTTGGTARCVPVGGGSEVVATTSMPSAQFPRNGVAYDYYFQPNGPTKWGASCQSGYRLSRVWLTHRYNFESCCVTAWQWIAPADRGAGFTKVPDAPREPGPQRTWRTKYTCRNGQVITERSSLFRETDTVRPDIPLPVCVDAKPPAAVKVYEDNYTGGAHVDGPEKVGWAPTETDPYPLCSSSTGACELTVQVLKPTGYVTCGTAAEPCAAFPSDVATRSYRCMWGTYEVPLTSCEHWRPGTTSTGTTPSPGPTSDPTEAPYFGPAVDPTPDETICQGVWRGWNPINWVLRPAKCALHWAFVPTEAQLEPMTELKESLSTRAPVSWLTDMTTFVTTALSGTGGDGCWLVEVDFPATLGGSIAVIDSCNGVVEQKVKALRPVLVASAFLSICGGLCWWAWRAYAPGAQGVA